MIAATEHNETNVRVFEDAEARQMLCNVVDVTHLCNFILPSIVRQGDLAIAVSTGGRQPRDGAPDPPLAGSSATATSTRSRWSCWARCARS